MILTKIQSLTFYPKVSELTLGSILHINTLGTWEVDINIIINSIQTLFLCYLSFCKAFNILTFFVLDTINILR